MARTIAYWTSTGIVALMLLLSLSYLLGRRLSGAIAARRPALP